ncbi:hypothetical protein SPRG_15730 [Saprolegnia parasitica CBS 223.65]|uniref:Uncharacterized protein n=1 Tax=Saprolegnia parasitica (strain CBS 223.65) TaxID=695850 RepID=A0A067BQK9_SAPPC|nr:hypothetical protein SPRG_15730 [Saprolegnia parasitica CBS 223.65]KDO19065.1 hypothetical protein SPRG_15730 [Saprolegnia parasitica CBS 223.65]|eukprot:XP_012210221.1 hypothetical protein SPRG_15730 [Saprolegnia parasitica CBS 223.65]
MLSSSLVIATIKIIAAFLPWTDDLWTLLGLDRLRYVDTRGLNGLPQPVTTRVFRWSNVGLTDTILFGDADNLGHSLAPASRLEELHVRS